MNCLNGQKLRILAVLISVVLMQVAVRAQEYGFDTWTTANGLPQNTVTGVVQTPDGYLWISTLDGLARFDGVRFTVFDKGNTRGIVNNRFTCVMVDKDGALWASTENNVVTVYRNGTFESYQPAALSGNTIYIVAGADREAVIETRDALFHLQDGNLRPTVDQKKYLGKQFYYGRSGARWTIEPNRVTWERDGRTVYYDVDLPSEFWSSGNAMHPLEDSQGALWILWGRTICRLAGGRATAYTQKEIPGLSELIPQLVFEDAEGGVWINLETSGASQNGEGQLVRFKDNNFTAHNLGRSVNATNSVTDREGNVWLASASGLKRLHRQLITSLSVSNGLVNDEVYPLLQTGSGDIFIGTVRGIDRYADGKITNTGLNYDTSEPLYVRGLWEDDKARLWIGFQGEGGFGRYEPPSHVKHIGQSDLPGGATDFASDRDGNVWIATEEGLFEYRDDQKVAHYTDSDGLQNEKIITLHFDRGGNLWLGTFDGLSEFKDGRFINYNNEPNSPKGFVRVIYEDGEGVLWFGTYGDGLVRYKEGKFFNYRVEDGLFNNGVFAILDDGRGNFWMSSNRGIHRVSIKELNDLADGKIPKLNSVSYGQKDGMLNAECNGGRIPAAIKARDGRLWFATMGGLAIVDPAAETPDPNPPPVLIENISIDRQVVAQEIVRSATGDGRSDIELEPGQSNIAIEYTGLSLIRSDQIKFRYKLEGLEENWVEAGTRRSVDYSYLPAGGYTFRVTAANANGVWNLEGASFRVIVHPYIYQTWWFKALEVLAIALIVWFVYNNRVSRLRAIADARSAYSRQLIESQEAERKRIASELHDGLGQSLVIIKNRAMLGLGKGDDPKRVAKELGSISDSAAQALDEVREITNNLRPQLLDRLGLTKAISSMLKKVAGVIEIKSEIDPIDDIFSESEEISIYRIIQESVNNIIKHSNASNAGVRIKRNKSKVSINIEDNGSGFDIEAAAANRAGLGLVGLRERAQLLGGQIFIDSVPGKGTLIRVDIDVE